MRVLSSAFNRVNLLARLEVAVVLLSSTFALAISPILAEEADALRSVGARCVSSRYDVESAPSQKDSATSFLKPHKGEVRTHLIERAYLLRRKSPPQQVSETISPPKCLPPLIDGSHLQQPLVLPRTRDALPAATPSLYRWKRLPSKVATSRCHAPSSSFAEPLKLLPSPIHNISLPESAARYRGNSEECCPIPQPAPEPRSPRCC